MSISLKRIFKISGIVLLVAAAGIAIGGYVVTGRAEKAIQEKLRAAGIHVQQVRVSLLNRSIQLDSITYTPTDTITGYPHALRIRQVQVSGIHILRLLRHDELMINKVVIREGLVSYNKNVTLPKKSAPGTGEKPFTVNRIHVGNIHLNDIKAMMMNDSLTESSATLDELQLSDLDVTLGVDTVYTTGDLTFHLKNLSNTNTTSLHTFSLAHVTYNSHDARMEIDSFKITPKHNKTDFARIARIQKTRLDIVLPKVVLEGMDHRMIMRDSVFRATRIFVPNPVVHAYRDKHYPFVRDWIMPLPIEGLRRLPFALDIDSVVVQQAEIAYEEFSVSGLQATGTITFNKLNASFANLTTVDKNPPPTEFCTLLADCQVMNSGALHATFKLPLNGRVNYQASGSVRNMDLTSLNPSLGNLSRVEITAGTLNELFFNFSYNDNVSTGEVLINYADLKLGALKKDKRHETNKLLTTVINVIVKTSKDKSVARAERTGIINIARDKKRFVFQFWWKSLLDGLQSVFLNNGKKKKTDKRSS